MTTGSIDVHSHYIAPAYRSALESVSKVGSAAFRCHPWTPNLRSASWTPTGIARQVLSVSDPGVPTSSPARRRRVGPHRNDYLAGVVASHPDASAAWQSYPEMIRKRRFRNRPVPSRTRIHAGLGLLSSYDGSYLR